MATIKNAVIAAGGLGTRFLPQTKAMPKEMLPIVDRPVIQIIVEDIVASGVENVIVVTGPQKKPVEDHFDHASELSQELRANGKDDKADEIERIADLANFIYVRQRGPYGNARPIYSTANITSGEPFFYFYADDFFVGKSTAAEQMRKAHEATGKSVLALRKVPGKDIEKYGVVKPGKSISDTVFEIESIIEKPKLDSALSDLASVHGYLFTPEIIDLLDPEDMSSRGEFEIQPAINRLAEQGKVVGCVIEGDYYDAGNVLNYLEAVVDMALKNDNVKDEFKEYLQQRVEKFD